MNTLLFIQFTSSHYEQLLTLLRNVFLKIPRCYYNILHFEALAVDMGWEVCTYKVALLLSLELNR